MHRPPAPKTWQTGKLNFFSDAASTAVCSCGDARVCQPWQTQVASGKLDGVKLSMPCDAGASGDLPQMMAARPRSQQSANNSQNVLAKADNYDKTLIIKRTVAAAETRNFAGLDPGNHR